MTQMYVYVVSYCFSDTFACVPCCFIVYGKYFPVAPSFISSLIYPLPPRPLPPGLLSPSPVPFRFVGLLLNR
jgi:hypothetical protein